MTPPPDRDAALDRILQRFALPAELSMDQTPSSEQCLDAETVAAMADGGLSPDEQSAVAEHALTCPRCREVIAAVIRTTPELAEEPLGWRTWLRVPSVRWLAPLAATGLAVAVWVAVGSRHPNVTSVSAPVLAPEKREAVIIPGPQGQKAKTDTEPARKAFSDLKAEPPKQEAPQEKTAGGRAIESDALTDRQSPLQRERSKTEPVNQLAAAKATQKLNEEALDKLEKKAADAAPAPATPPPPASPAAPLPTASNEAGRAAAIGGAGAAGGAGRSGRTEGFADRAAAGALAETVTIAIPDIPSPDSRSRWRIRGTSVQRSTDNGETWTDQETGTTVRLTAGSSPNPDICWLVGDQGTVLVSVDGRSWQRLKSPDPTLLVSVSATSADAATVTTGDGRTFATTDRGQTWEQK